MQKWPLVIQFTEQRPRWPVKPFPQQRGRSSRMFLTLNPSWVAQCSCVCVCECVCVCPARRDTAAPSGTWSPGRGQDRGLSVREQGPAPASSAQGTELRKQPVLGDDQGVASGARWLLFLWSPQIRKVGAPSA
jgi:hypothetical protein